MDQEHNNQCQNCGAMMEFDVGTQALKCPHCGTVIKILNDTSRIVEHPLTAASAQRIHVAEKKSATMECKSCGARIEVEPTCTATSCPYCGAPYVLAEKQEEVIIPDGVMPFQIDRDKCGDLFRNWLKGRFFAPRALRMLYQQGKLQGVYLPYWTFDADAGCYYTAQGGRRHTRVVRDRNGHEHTETWVEWFPTSGHVGRFFDDILIRASEKLDSKLLGGIEPFDTHHLNSYSPDYFAGYEAECCSREIDIAHNEAREIIEAELHRMASRDVLRRFDEVRFVNIRPEYHRETYKHVILPVYATAYDYKGRKYTVLVNGQSGKIKGGYPKSPAKIGALIAAIAAVIILLIYLFIGDNGGSSHSASIEYDSEYVYEMLTDASDTVGSALEIESILLVEGVRTFF